MSARWPPARGPGIAPARMSYPAPFEPAFLADIPYDPSVLFLDRIESVDREASRIVCRMPTLQPMPFTDHQRVHPAKHPRHVGGAVMVQVTANLGFVHAYHLEGLRHAEGWIGYGAIIEKARFRKLVQPGEPMFCSITQKRARRGKGRLYSVYRFEFRHEGDVAYESEQSAMWLKIEGDTAPAGLFGG